MAIKKTNNQVNPVNPPATAQQLQEFANSIQQTKDRGRTTPQQLQEFINLIQQTPGTYQPKRINTVITAGAGATGTGTDVVPTGNTAGATGATGSVPPAGGATGGTTGGTTGQQTGATTTQIPKTMEDTSKDMAASFGGGGVEPEPETPKPTPAETYAEQYTQLADEMKKNFGITTKNTLAQRDNTIASIEAKGVADRATLQASYEMAESKIGRAISVLSGSFGISKNKMQDIIDSQSTLTQTFQANLTELAANEQIAINNADLTAASSLATQQKDMLDFMTTMIGKQLDAAQKAQDTAISQVNTLVDSGALADVDDKTLISLAEASGYDVYALNAMKKAVKTGNESDIAKAKADLEYTQAQTAKAKAEASMQWSDPYLLGGDYVQKNTITGEIRTAVNVPKDGGTDTSELLSILDVDRYNQLYPDAGITAGDTIASANAKVAASIAPREWGDDEINTAITEDKKANKTYEEVIAGIDSESTISNKSRAKELAAKTYGKKDDEKKYAQEALVGEAGFDQVSPIEQDIAELSTSGVLWGSDIRYALKKRGYTDAEINASSVASGFDQTIAAGSSFLQSVSKALGL